MKDVVRVMIIRLRVMIIRAEWNVDWANNQEFKSLETAAAEAAAAATESATAT